MNQISLEIEWGKQLYLRSHEIMRWDLLFLAGVKLEIGLQSDHTQLKNLLLRIGGNIVQIYECVGHHQQGR